MSDEKKKTDIISWIKKRWFIVTGVAMFLCAFYGYAQDKTRNQMKQAFRDSTQTVRIDKLEKDYKIVKRNTDSIFIYLKADQMYKERVNPHMAKETLEKAQENHKNGDTEPDSE